MLSIEQLESRQCLAANIEHVANINQLDPFVEVRNTASAGDLFYLIAAQRGEPRQLWRTDGTTDSTVALLDLTDTTSFEMANVNGILYFAGTSPAIGEELWRTDGTVAGTRLVKDLTPGAADSALANMFPIDNQLYFTNRRDLYVSDGTVAGTRRVADLVPGVADNVFGLTRVNSTLYFVAGNSSTDFGLYKTDGTTVQPITSIPRGFLSQLKLVGSDLFFVYNESLSKLDTTNDSFTEVMTIFPEGLTEFNGDLIFASDRSIWTSDGTSAGTREVARVSGYPSGFFNFQGVLYFAAGNDQYSSTGVELWRSDGTATGTFMLKDIDSGTHGFYYGDSSFPSNFTNFNGQLVFKTRNSNVEGLWTTDGTADGTVPLELGTITHFSVAGDRLLAVRTTENAQAKQLLQFTSGSAQPELIVPPGADQGSSNPSPVLELNGQYYLFADDGIIGRELYRLNADNSLTLVKEIAPGPASTTELQFTKANGRLYFTFNDPLLGNGLYSSDGTAAGTARLRSFNWVGTSLVPMGNQVYFSAFDRGVGGELWKTDGTVAGTVLVKDIAPGGYSLDPFSSFPSYLTVYRGQLYFTAQANQRELWRSDGTAAGTQLAVDVYPGPASSNVRSITVYKDRMYFAANNSRGLQLFRSDGTIAGTAAVTPRLQNIGAAVVAAGSLFFSAQTAATGAELWKVTGNGQAVQVKDIRAGGASSFPSQLTHANGKLYFAANNGIHGTELWQSDGTAAGTVTVRDIRPGAVGSYPRLMRALNGVLFFSANDGSHGTELWQTNGAVSGATLVEDLNPGASSSFPAALTQRGDELLFRAFNPSTGTELLSVRSAAPVLTLPTAAPAYRGPSPVRLAPQATLADSDTAIFYGGQLTVSLGTTYRPQDQLIVSPTSTVSLQQSRVLVQGVLVGVISTTASSSDLSIFFTQAATRERVREVIRSIAYRSQSSTPATGLRQISFTLRDGSAGESLTQTVTIDVA